MKKFLAIGFVFLAISMFAQYGNNEKNNRDVNVLIERSEYFGISGSQKSKILSLKKTAGKDFENIGRNRNLSGYEKGRKKREVSAKLQKDVNNVLNESQRKKWSEFYNDDSRNNAIDKKIDLLEDEYEADIKRIEKKYSNDKTLMKNKKEARKARYKKEKEVLKANKNK